MVYGDVGNGDDVWGMLGMGMVYVGCGELGWCIVDVDADDISPMLLTHVSEIRHSYRFICQNCRNP